MCTRSCVCVCVRVHWHMRLYAAHVIVSLASNMESAHCLVYQCVTHAARITHTFSPPIRVVWKPHFSEAKHKACRYSYQILSLSDVGLEDSLTPSLLSFITLFMSLSISKGLSHYLHLSPGFSDHLCLPIQLPLYLCLLTITHHTCTWLLVLTRTHTDTRDPRSRRVQGFAGWPC